MPFLAHDPHTKKNIIALQWQYFCKQIELHHNNAISNEWLGSYHQWNGVSHYKYLKVSSQVWKKMIGKHWLVPVQRSQDFTTISESMQKK